MTPFLILSQIWHVWVLQFWVMFLVNTFISKTPSLRYVSEKVPSAKWPHKLGEKISCFRQNLDFSIGFATKISIFKLRPLFRFLCLINSFYRRYVSCVYTISNISNISPIYPIYFVYSIHSIHSVIRSYVLGFLAYFPCRISSSHRTTCLRCTMTCRYGDNKKSTNSTLAEGNVKHWHLCDENLIWAFS